MYKKNYDKMVAEKEVDKQNIWETAEKQILQLNAKLEKTNQQFQILRQEKVKRNHVYPVLHESVYFCSVNIKNILTSNFRNCFSDF